jgi:hypothetical protein
MKHVLVVAFVLCCYNVSAQKHNVFADVSTPLAGSFPGGSLTYNYKLSPRFGGGIGVQGNENRGISEANFPMFVPAVFADIRFYFRPEKKNRFFSFVDIGMTFLKDTTAFYSNAVYDIGKNGFYLGTGFGYFRPVTKRGWGPYATLKLLGNHLTTRTYYFQPQREDVRLGIDGSIDIAIGFKF